MMTPFCRGSRRSCETDVSTTTTSRSLSWEPAHDAGPIVMVTQHATGSRQTATLVASPAASDSRPSRRRRDRNRHSLFWPSYSVGPWALYQRYTIHGCQSRTPSLCFIEPNRWAPDVTLFRSSIRTSYVTRLSRTGCIARTNIHAMHSPRSCLVPSTDTTLPHTVRNIGGL